MGQYYRAIISNINERKVFESENLKLTEQAAQRNLQNGWETRGFVCNVMEHLECSPHFVAWVGDYSEALLEIHSEFPKNWEYAMFPKYQEVWGENAKVLCLDDDIHGNPWSRLENMRYLLNFSKELYVDLVELWKIRMEEPKQYIYYAPLPLLTAIGNGRGGGDYNLLADDADKVGSWAWDGICVENIIPEGFKKLEVNFREEW